jgi:hypothetical protein
VALKEVAQAVALNKRIAPIVCRHVEDGATLETLRRLNFVFFDDPAKFEASVDKLTEALQTDITWIRRNRAPLVEGRPSRRSLAALASFGGGRALDRLAPARRSGTD